MAGLNGSTSVEGVEKAFCEMGVNWSMAAETRVKARITRMAKKITGLFDLTAQKGCRGGMSPVHCLETRIDKGNRYKETRERQEVIERDERERAIGGKQQLSSRRNNIWRKNPQGRSFNYISGPWWRDNSPTNAQTLTHLSPSHSLTGEFTRWGKNENEESAHRNSHVYSHNDIVHSAATVHANCVFVEEYLICEHKLVSYFTCAL